MVILPSNVKLKTAKGCVGGASEVTQWLRFSKDAGERSHGSRLAITRTSIELCHIELELF